LLDPTPGKSVLAWREEREPRFNADLGR
jgi:hypothetical protein